MGVFDLGDLRQRHRDAVARGDGEIADMAEIEPLGRHRARDHADLLDAVAHRGDRRARDQHAQRLRHVLRGEAERAGAILIDHQLQVRRLLVPVELRILDLVVLPDHVAHLVGDVAHGLGIGADHAELDGKPTGGPKLKRSTRTRASVSAPSSTAFSSRALIRSRASTSLATMTISAKASFGSCGLSPSQKRGEPWPT